MAATPVVQACAHAAAAVAMMPACGTVGNVL